MKEQERKKKKKDEEDAPPSEAANVSPSSAGTCRALSRSLLLPTCIRLQITGEIRLQGLGSVGSCCLFFGGRERLRRP